MSDSGAAQALLDTFDQIVVINLPDRKDRRRAIEAELARAGLAPGHPAVTLFRAIRPETPGGFPSIGVRGAFLSHLGVMERMLDQGWARMLVLEDDMAFSPGALARLPALAAALRPRVWDVLCVHPGDRPALTPPPDAQGLIALPADLALIQLHFLGLRRAAAARMVPQLHAMLARDPGSPEGGPMHVDGALNWIRRQNPDLTALAISPALARQRPSRSDIAHARWYDRLPLVRSLSGLLRRLRP